MYGALKDQIPAETKFYNLQSEGRFLKEIPLNIH